MPSSDIASFAADTVAQFAAVTRGISKNDIYEVGHCSLVSASHGDGDPVPWRQGDIMGDVLIME